MRLSHVVPLALAAMLASGGGAAAKTVKLVGLFSPEGTASTKPSGTARATLNTATDILNYKITYAGLSGPVQAAHFHGPAAPGTSAGVLVPIPGPYHSGMTGSTKVSVQAAQDLADGRTYINLHTAAQPDGEARAQMNKE